VRKVLIILSFSLLLLFFAPQFAEGQCSICTKTAQQLGEKPAQGLNEGILYLLFTPLAIGGYIGYRWWRSNKSA